MAYFPNGSSGMDYEEEFCSRCAHNQNPDKGCPVMGIHLLYNYDQFNDGERVKDDKTREGVLNNILSYLIPESKDHLANEQCSMFLSARSPRPAVREKQMSLWKGKS